MDRLQLQPNTGSLAIPYNCLDKYPALAYVLLMFNSPRVRQLIVTVMFCATIITILGSTVFQLRVRADDLDCDCTSTADCSGDYTCVKLGDCYWENGELAKE